MGLYSVDVYAPPNLMLEVNGDAHSSACPLNDEALMIAALMNAAVINAALMIRLLLIIH